MILLETLIFEDESGIRTIGPSNEDMVQVRGGSQVIELSDDNDEEPFVTPILLDKKRRRIAPQAIREDTEEEDSEVERQLRGKKGSLVKTQNFKKADKVR
jgi:hypothetical protein